MNGVTSLLRTLPAYARLRRSQYRSGELQARSRDEALREILSAASRLPFYQARLGPSPRVEAFDRLPLLRRSEVRELAAAVRAAYPAGTRFEANHSSGSTGMPAEFLFDQPHQVGRFGTRARYLVESGWTPWQRSAWIIFLQKGTPDARLIRNRLLPGSRFISVFTPPAEQVAWLRRVDPESIYTLPSNLEALTDLLSPADVPSLRLVMTGGEVVDEGLRDKVRRLFGREISDNYGSTEAFLAWRCPRGRYHLNAEHVHLEVVGDDGRPVPPGVLGRAVVTTLQNQLMPLVRYEIGDYVALSGEACPCGRTLPVISQIAGRAVQLFRLGDGRVISPFELIIRVRAREGFRQFQIVQLSPNRFRLRYVSDDPLPEEPRLQLVRDFTEVIREKIDVDFERMESIPRTATGKYLTAVSEMGTNSPSAR